MVDKDWGDRWGSDATIKNYNRNCPSSHFGKYMSSKLYLQCSIDNDVCFKLTKEILGKLKVKMLLGVDTNIRVKGIRYRKASISREHITSAYHFNGKAIKATYISNGVWKLKVI